MSIHWPIIRRCLAAPLRTAIVDDQRSLSGGRLLVASLILADEVARRCQGPTVGIALPTSGLFPIAALACWIAGKVVVPLNYLLKTDELQYIIDDSRCDTVLTARGMLEFMGYRPKVKHLLCIDDIDFRAIPEPRWPATPNPHDLGVLLYTSGTSGRPKGVMLTHDNISANLRQIRRHINFTPKEVLLGVLPQFHTFGLTVLTLLPLTVGCKVVYTARFVPGRIVGLIRTHRATAFVGIPSMYNALLHVKDAGPADFSSMWLAVSGGEPLPQDMADRFHARFAVRINEGYGLTETAPVTNWCQPWTFRRGSVGPPLPEVLERIVDIETGLDLGPGLDGEVRIKGPNLMAGYFNQPDLTAAAIDERGYFRTGDIGRTDSDGHLYITGRLKEMLIIAGENVFPREIEEALTSHPAIKDAGVVGAADPIRGELPLAFVELKEGAVFNKQDVLNHLRKLIAAFKLPTDIRVLEALPRSATGKVLRRELKKLA